MRAHNVEDKHKIYFLLFMQSKRSVQIYRYVQIGFIEALKSDTNLVLINKIFFQKSIPIIWFQILITRVEN